MSTPDAVLLTAELDRIAATDLALWLIEAMAKADFAPVSESRLTVDDERGELEPGVRSDRLTQLASEAETLVSVWLRLEDGSNAYVNPGVERDSSLLFEANTRGASRAEIATRVAGLIELLRGVTSLGPGEASVSWQGDGALCLPELPVVGGRSYAVATSEPALRESFVEPDTVRQAFDDVEIDGDRGRWILSRAVASVTGPEFLSAVMDGQWRMARAARPGLTGYGLIEVEDDEAPIFFAGERRLRLAGYDVGASRLEYTGVLEPGEHVQPYEVFELLDLMEEGETSNGQPVLEIRVLFLDRAAAEAEKRPLLDVGARVAYMDESGEFVDVSDD